MVKKSLCAVALIAAALPAVADEFTYLSGGLLWNNQGYATELNKKITDDDVKADKMTRTDNHAIGFYLNGSVGFENNMFVNCHAQVSKKINEYLLGVGYHYPVMQQVDVYGLLGVVNRQLDVSLRQKQGTDGDGKGEMKDLATTTQYLDQLRPTVEIGAKARITEEAGLQFAYRWAQFGNSNAQTKLKTWQMRKDDKLSTNLHEGRIGGYYNVADNLAVEAGYSFTASLDGALSNVTAKMPKPVKDEKGVMLKDHAVRVGVRYSF